MSLLKLYPSQDAFISLAQPNNNFGRDEILELTLTSNTSAVGEATRLLIQFDTSSQKFTNATSGAYTATLTIYNCPNNKFTDENWSVNIYALTQSWNEGINSVMFPSTGAVSYVWRTLGNTWTSSGGTYSASPSSTVTFISGTENLTANLSAFINYWNAGNPNYGLLIKFQNEGLVALSGDYSNTKTLFSRNTHTYYQPHLSIVWNGDPNIQDDIHNMHVGTNNLYVYDTTESSSSWPGIVQLKENLMLSGSTAYSVSYVASNIWTFNVSMSQLAWPYGLWVVTSNTATGVSITSAFTGYQSYFQSTFYTSEIDASFLTNSIYFQEDTPILRAHIFKNVYRGMGSLALDYYPNEVYVHFRERNTFTQATPEQLMSYDGDGHFYYMDMSNLLPNFYYVPVLKIVTPQGTVIKKFNQSAFFVQSLTAYN